MVLTWKFYLGTGQEDIKALERGYEKVSFVILVHYLKYSLFRSYIWMKDYPHLFVSEKQISQTIDIYF